jgi:hypothetical protein
VSRMVLHLDSFSGAAASLKRGQRDCAHVLEALRRDPLVSTWDMSEHWWLRVLIADLVARGLITQVPEAYPWLRYEGVKQ